MTAVWSTDFGAASAATSRLRRPPRNQRHPATASPEASEQDQGDAESSKPLAGESTPPSPMPKAASWPIPSRYELRACIGRGSYGTVREALDQEMGRMVAIKRLHSVFSDPVNSKRILRELAILKRLEHSHVVRLFDIIAPQGPGETEFDELYIVMELGDADLKTLFQKEVRLEQLQVDYILYNLLVGLKYLHSAGIYHRDLKPSNVLVNQDCSVKICDFGLARAVGEEEPENPSQASSDESSPNPPGSSACKAHRVMTKHVVTRFYRAPELILLEDRYTESIDVWSVGCILVELAEMMEPWPAPERGPLFPGSTCFPLSPDGLHRNDGLFHSTVCREQLNVIFDVLGTPSDEDIEGVGRDDARRYLRCFQQRQGTGIQARLPGASADVVGIIERMLQFSPQDRATVEEILQHPLFQDIRSPEMEVTAPSYFTLEFDQESELSEKDLRRCFSEEIRSFQRAQAR
eukprot:CAMPEP_0115069042 /NCGR_PEP_ID=MMETSP0227-20121206/12337_1 /TAXON_ID=89957 /ORGANISM="Polarella glacialis, Strain CCMP 1383" /LENGTH=463 /DNA_ID=CAMNT_0002455399 /DNA_START=134 /DNA_END=1525 /DNA_ORIENTATION=+